MINKKFRSILKTASYSMALCMAVNSAIIPVVAKENKSEISSAYENNLNIYNIGHGTNNVIEQKGFKFTVDNIKASKNRIKVTMTVESNEDISTLLRKSLEIRVSLNNGLNCSSSYSYNNTGNNKMEIVEELRDINGFSEKNILRVDVVCGKLDINTALKIPIDLTEAFKQEFFKEINYELSNDEKIEVFKSNNLASSILVSKKYIDPGIYDKEKYIFRKYILKVDDKYYVSSFPEYMYEEDSKEINEFEFKGVSYDAVKNADSINLITFENTMSDDEIYKFNNNEDVRDFEEIKEKDNISYPEKIKLSDGTTGNIQVKRNDGKILIAVNGETDKHSLMMLSSLSALYSDDEEYYNIDESGNAYKDGNGYIVEFKDVFPEQKLVIYIDEIIYNIDKCIMYDEIKIK